MASHALPGRPTSYARTSAAVAVLLLTSSVFARNVDIETLTVGDVGNAADPLTGRGAVNYQYSIGKYEVTNAQYAAFLNAKAALHDPYSGLYNTNMAGSFGGIIRSGAGSIGSPYTYSTVSGRENWAVNFVGIRDAFRFVNWIANGQGNGSTETGSYDMLASYPTRSVGATWVVASQDEWYKAAYYQGGSLNAGYWRFPTQSNTITTAMANYNNSVGSVTPVGSYAFTSAYGAFDMGGNVGEWTDTLTSIASTSYFVLGGRWDSPSNGVWSENPSFLSASLENRFTGFRVAFVPGPGPLAALALGSLLTRGRRRGA